MKWQREDKEIKQVFFSLDAEESTPSKTWHVSRPYNEDGCFLRNFHVPDHTICQFLVLRFAFIIA